MAETLSADAARRLALHAQGLLGGRDRGGVPAVLQRLGAVQLDTISVLARSHELVAYARLGAVGRARVERAYWAEPATAFEYWAHAACVLPVETWPLFAFRRREYADRHPWVTTDAAARQAVLDRLRADGPLTASDLGGAKQGGPWWDWSEAKRAVEHLVARGDVVVTRRRGWKRVYDLPERALPAEVLGDDLPDAECVRRLVTRAGRALGVATRADLADYYRVTQQAVEAVLPDTALLPVSVEGWRRPAYADPVALAALEAGAIDGARSRTTLLSPFDSLIWFRERTERIFGMVHRLEAYVPAPDREHGYFATPVLAGGRLIGRVDPARSGRTLVARQVSVDRASGVPRIAAALREAATWVGCDAVAVERVLPESLAGAMRAAVAG